MTAPFLLVCALLAGQASAEASAGNIGLKWQTDLASAQRQARESGRLVLIHFGGPWCEPCRRLEQQVFSQPGFGSDLSTRYVAVKIDPRQQHQLAEKYGVRAVPTDVVTTARGQLVMRIESPNTPAAYNDTLKHIADTVQPPPQEAVAVAAANAAITPAHPPEAAQQASVDRYADYYNRRRRGSSPPVDNASADAGQNTAPPSQPAAVAEIAHEPPAAAPQAPQFAFDRYCPVTLIEKRRWEQGDERWGAIHRGRTYLFASEGAQKAFMADPDRYSPVYSGNDPVLRVEYHQDIPGKREHGAFYQNRIYLFTSEDTFHRFNRDPARYTAEVSRQVKRR